MQRRDNGEGTIYQRSDGRWGATISLPDGRRKTVYARTRKDVRDRMAELNRRRDAGLLLASSDQLTGDYLERWLEDSARPSVRPRTFQTYAGNLRRLLPLIGRVKLGSLSPAHIQHAYAALLRGGLSARSVRHSHAVLHMALKQAVLWNLIPRNPSEAATRPRPERHEMRTLTDEHLRRLFAATDQDRFNALWTVLATTGVRLGEALGLRWDDLDTEGGRITIKRSLQRQQGLGLVLAEPKSSRSRRTLYLPQIACQALLRHRRGQAAEHLMAGPAWQEHGLIFATTIGRPLDPRYVNRRLHTTLRAAGLPDVRVHDLRHTAATLLLSKQVHPKLVQEMLGHSSIALTLDTYSHVLPAMAPEAARQMDAILGGTAPALER